MPDDLLSNVKRVRCGTHQRLLGLVADLTQEQLAWRPGPHAPSIGFHLWHVTRWADVDIQQLNGAEQVWKEQRLAERWGIAESELGATGTGSGMGDEASERLDLPSKQHLIGYAEAVLGAFAVYVEAVVTKDLSRITVSPGDQEQRATVASLLVGPLAHENNHLGMIEALRGLLEVQDAATN